MGTVSLSVERGLHVEDGLLGGFEHCVEAAQHGHGEDDVPVLAAYVDVAEHVVRDAPDVVGDPVEVPGGGRSGGLDLRPALLRVIVRGLQLS